jgi:hypothetical protein
MNERGVGQIDPSTEIFHALMFLRLISPFNSEVLYLAGRLNSDLIP